MEIIVLGGSGFLGSHVADQLTLAGHEVRIFDSSESPWIRSDQTMLIGDLMDKTALYKAIQGCDIVYNFAAIADLDEARSRDPFPKLKKELLDNGFSEDDFGNFDETGNIVSNRLLAYPPAERLLLPPIIVSPLP